MELSSFILKFDGVPVADANKYAASLRERLRDAHPDIEVQLQREDPTSQDFGASLVLILGTPTFVAAVAAIKAWLSRTNAASLQIWHSNGMLVARNLESKDVPEIVRALSGLPTK